MSRRQSSGGPEVYTDGACENNGQYNAKAGIGVYWGPNDYRNVSEALKGRQTNNRAEIQAAVRAIVQGGEQDLPEMTIICDSEFLIKSMTQWVDGWRKYGWRTINGEPVENRTDFEELIEASKGIRVNWEYVAAHSGNPGNEAADLLAKKGILKHR